jgi:hypothetical protein
MCASRRPVPALIALSLPHSRARFPAILGGGQASGFEIDVGRAANQISPNPGTEREQD